LDQTAISHYKPLAGREAFELEGLAADITVFQPIRDSQVWEPHVIAVLERIIQPGFVCLDVGANIGAITLPLARLASDGHVHAFEASPTAFELLKRNISSNGLTNATPVHAAITNLSGDTLEIFSPGANLGWAHTTFGEQGREGTREEVQTLALDDYGFAGNSLQRRCDLIKMDVEGGEIKALRGAMRMIEQHHPALVIEYNPAPAEWFAGNSRRALYDVLTALYPNISIIGPGGGLEQVMDWEQLDRELTVHTWRDLLCTF
jgi:FkbM family methyltransferase